MSKKPKFPERTLFVCVGSKCKKIGSNDLVKQLHKKIKAENFQGIIEVLKMECTGRCKFAPIACLQPHNQWFCQFSSKEMRHILESEMDCKTTSGN